MTGHHWMSWKLDGSENRGRFWFPNGTIADLPHEEPPIFDDLPPTRIDGQKK
jgi:hypothetical protein